MNLQGRPTRRLFTFGCSFTKYFWPTWADIVNKQVRPLEYHNTALMGSGNAYISHSFHLNNIIHNFGPDDLVLICWSNIFRNDWFIDFEWSQEGNVYANTGKYNSVLHDELKDPTHYLARDLMNIYSVMNVCEQTGCRYKHLTMVPMFDFVDDSGLVLFTHQEFDNHNVKHLLNFIRPRLEKSFTEVLGQKVEEKWLGYFPNNPDWDRHPLPTHHLEYLKTIFYDTDFDSGVIASVEQAESTAVNILDGTEKDTEKFQQYFEEQEAIELC